MQLPRPLRQAIESELARHAPGRVAEASAELSRRYRAPDAASGAFISSTAERAAYLGVRMPATYAAVRAALAQVKEAWPDFAPINLLDLGAGPGTAMWAAVDVFGGLSQTTLVERDRELIEFGRRLAKHSGDAAIRSAEWRAQDLREMNAIEPHDLIVASYALGEVDAEARRRVVRAAWQAARGVFVVIEPGTKRGSGQILEMRDALIGQGAHVVAPCPHANRCPLSPDDWCHFAARVERTSAHRRIKAGSLGYEDEKYSYLAVAKTPMNKASARIIRHPQHRVGHLHLDLCTPTGLERVTLSKKHREAYKRARKTEWGEAWEDAAEA